MKVLELPIEPLGWKKSILWLALAVACFHAAYISVKIPALGLFIFGYAFSLVQLTDQPNVRRAFYFGLAAGFLCAAPQLFFFWKIFNAAAIVLWIVFALWIGMFTAISCGAIRRWGKIRAMWLVPIIWTGCEYFRSELYYLKFSWLNIGYALPMGSAIFGMYGMGFVAVFLMSLFVHRRLLSKKIVRAIYIAIVVLVVCSIFLPSDSGPPKPIAKIIGIQLEFPSAGILPKILDQTLAKNTNAQIFVFSEYTLDGGPPDSLKKWCRDNSKFLVVGGKDFVTNHIYYNTAFVVGTNGEIVFKQAKSVPIQFFDDGLPAQKQELWNSPFGKIGICICYDLSYTRVTDELVRQGAQLLIVPTMDVSEWGKHEHELHSRVAPVRAAEYGIPIFRLASSGISQAVTGKGGVVAQTDFDKQDEILFAQLRLPMRGTLPLDRFLAPICMAITVIILVPLLFFTRKDKHTNQKPISP